jgi:hypothetical protein
MHEKSYWQILSGPALNQYGSATQICGFVVYRYRKDLNKMKTETVTYFVA